MREAGLPDGVLNVVTTSRTSEVVSALMADERLRKVSFTGSTAVGRTLLAQASQNVLRTSMELGGNAPFIVFEDADIRQPIHRARGRGRRVHPRLRGAYGGDRRG